MFDSTKVRFLTDSLNNKSVKKDTNCSFTTKMDIQLQNANLIHL